MPALWEDENPRVSSIISLFLLVSALCSSVFLSPRKAVLCTQTA